jgi:YebC/PmpR family DNA-binding regulatory protein
MSGHSKWHTIKHKKGAADAKRGKVFTRIIKELTVAARNGGGDPDMNPRLRSIIADAKQVNMPADNIKRAIRRGTGEEEGVTYEEVTYEGYGPGGVAVLIEALTDNKNRTVGEIRHTFTKWGGKLGEPNTVARMFHKKGLVVVLKSKASEEALMDAVLEAGADDMNDDGDAWEILTTPDVHPAVVEKVKSLGIEPSRAEIAMVPTDYIKLEGKAAQQMLKLVDALEEHDDTKTSGRTSISRNRKSRLRWRESLRDRSRIRAHGLRLHRHRRSPASARLVRGYRVPAARVSRRSSRTDSHAPARADRLGAS